ncbi:hypothetical protein [Propionispora hippei]|uniref:Uncharacterized protein n=1 Tax=Propionispora hippei DSM 15287 TaxID=1123003 RepID=A0A1M6AM97_9FIRM|nr:hypothetical protein [Propionispora hippei]SHI37596.1 hypothetical protein SAMN02745170_00211 [Propionispora hippei DSM 15287]
MDIIIPILLMLVLYLLPELLRRGKPKKYEYPEIPEPAPPANMPSGPPVKGSKPAVLPAYPEVVIPQTAVSLASTDKTTGVVPSLSVDRNMLLQAVIYSEILQKPRAYRPICQKRR